MNHRFNDTKQVGEIAKNILSSVIEKLDNNIKELKIVYNVLNVDYTMDCIDRYKKQGFKIKDFDIATENKEGYYFLKRN